MDEDWGGGPPAALGGKGKDKGGEVDYKSKSGTAWSHNYLNQKPWHPLSYPNQRRKWIAEQTHAQRERRAEEIAREFAQEQEFFRQTALVSRKEKEKMEIMKAVSFMYVRPPGYNAESAKAAEIADERKKVEQSAGTSGQESAVPPSMPGDGPSRVDKKKDRPKDVFGRPLPSAEDFEVLKNAPRLETGVPVRIKPFAVEIRNVRCVRCGTHGHQSGDRECPLKDAIMPNDESRLMRDDPLRAIIASGGSSEPMRWELKQRPGISPPRGGFQPDDPNQQIIPEDIFDEYGGFLGDGGIPSELLNIGAKKSKKHSSRGKKHRKHLLTSERGVKDQHDGSSSSLDTSAELEPRKLSSKHGNKKRRHQEPYENPRTSSKDHCTARKSERKESRSKHVKKKRRHHEDSDTSTSSSEEYDIDGEERARKSKKKYADKSRRHVHDSSTRETSSGRHYHANRLTPSASDSSDSRVDMRKRKGKHSKGTHRYHHFRSDREDGDEKSRRDSRKKGMHYWSDTSSSFSSGHRDQHSAKRKHPRR